MKTQGKMISEWEFEIWIPKHQAASTSLFPH